MNDEVQDPTPNSVITIRMPKALHVMLKEAAFDHRTSMNRLCVAALESAIADRPAVSPENEAPRP